MKEVLADYSTAVEAHINAIKSETKARVLVQKTRYKLLQAKDALRAKEAELME